MCKQSEESGGRKLDVHHIDYNKLNTFKENCISLCNKCHIKTGRNRDRWTKYFREKLSERFGYKYNISQVTILRFGKKEVKENEKNISNNSVDCTPINAQCSEYGVAGYG